MSTFDFIMNKVENSPIGEAMKSTVENSPYHRESNTWVHTLMVLDQYNTRFAPIRSDKQNLIAKLALLFHDAGKNEAEEVLEKKDGSGELYRRYAGHEQVSAVEFQEFYVTSPELQSMIDPYEARAIRWIIEHHLPYGLKDNQKRKGLAQGTFEALKYANIGYETFFDCLRSDAAGRISDDHATKLANVEEWINEFQQIDPKFLTVYNCPKRMTILIGPSGSGKSTYLKKFSSSQDVVISLDNYRLEFANGFVDLPEDPAEAYKLAYSICEEQDSVFRNYTQIQTAEVFKSVPTSTGTVYIIDNTNLSKKSRAQYVSAARSKKMHITAVEFWNPLEVIVERQQTRGDKSVPYGVVRSQQNAQTCAWIGLEADAIQLIVNGNYDYVKN